MPDEQILLFDEHKLRKFDSLGTADDGISFFNVRIFNLMNEFAI